MSTSAVRDWRTDFGVGERTSPVFFGSRNELSGAPVTQAHKLRRAFDLLSLDGVLCSDSSPLVYFKRVSNIRDAEVNRLHQRFWNHGGAPILVLVGPSEVQVLSGLIRPAPHLDAAGRPPSLVDVIARTSDAIREFLPSVESGEFFRRHARSFDPEQRVDRDLLSNLQATRQKLFETSERELSLPALDALLCRLVFTCYLFDRDVIGEAYLAAAGIPGTSHLRDVLAIQPRATAKKHLYTLFATLGEDFNGDLFSDDLRQESQQVRVGHIDVLNAFFNATDVITGQQSFWPYDFGAIPVETISAIYERFLKDTDRQTGAFYTPRFLAEAVLDTALAGTDSLLGLRCLDPACGSGIFLVGLFNRMAEEWRQSNPRSRNNTRARELMKLLRHSLFGVDTNPTACRIAAFSLCLAYLDQLSPRDIQELQQKGRALPRLVNTESAPAPQAEHTGSIWHRDFFTETDELPTDVDLVVGNPPWGSIATDNTPAAAWCKAQGRPIPDRQIAAAFMWKAPSHISTHGRVCFVLPHGVLFNHSKKAIAFQRDFISHHAVERVLNLTDYQFFLFEEARHPALVISYGQHPRLEQDTCVDYWAPKADWPVTRAEIISIAPEDRTTVSVSEILGDLTKPDAPQVWKRYFWATARDRRLLDRLSEYPRLRDHVRQPRESGTDKPWLIAEGYQPLGPNDDASKAVELQLPSNRFIKASSQSLQLFLLVGECDELASSRVQVRARSNKNTQVFCGPHVIVSQGFSSIAYADFAVAFRHALRGITGPEADRNLLIFLAAYLRSRLARYYLFHTSSNWGVSRQKVHVGELLRLPFPRPDAFTEPSHQWSIVAQVANNVDSAASRAADSFADRKAIVRAADTENEQLIQAYFDVLPDEDVLIDDTVAVTIPSIRPTRKRKAVPTILPATARHIATYRDRLVKTLNGWAAGSRFQVHGSGVESQALGMGMVVLEKIHRRSESQQPPHIDGDLIAILDGLRQAVSERLNAFEFSRGVKVFQGERLVIVKPIAHRFWTETAALNDADEIAGTILLHAPKGE